MPQPCPTQQKSRFSCICLESGNWAHVSPLTPVNKPSMVGFVGPDTPTGTERDLLPRLPREPFSCPSWLFQIPAQERALLPHTPGFAGCHQQRRALVPRNVREAVFFLRAALGARCFRQAVVRSGTEDGQHGQLRGKGRSDHSSASHLHRSGWQHPPPPAGA